MESSLEVEIIKRHLKQMPREKRQEIWRVLIDMEDCVTGSMMVRHVSIQCAIQRLKDCLLSSPGSELWGEDIASISHVNMRLGESEIGSANFNRISNVSFYQGKNDLYGLSLSPPSILHDFRKHSDPGSFYFWINDTVGFDKVALALSLLPTQ